MNWNVHFSSSAHLENIKKEGFSELKHGIFPFLEDKGEGGSARPYPNKTAL